MELDAQIVSDVRFDLRTKTKHMWLPKATCDHLIVAGGIGVPSRKAWGTFVEHCSRHWKHTFYVLGATEYASAGSTVDETEEYVDACLERLGNVHRLSPGVTHCIDNVRLVGCTLWHPYTPSSYHEMAYEKRIAGFSPRGLQATHSQHLDWIAESTRRAREDGVPCVVVTGHAPAAIDVSCSSWVFGGTTVATDQNANGVRLLANPVGDFEAQRQGTGYRDAPFRLVGSTAL